MNDVIKELQREKESNKQEMENLKTIQQTSQKKLENLEEVNSKLQHENEAKDDTIERLRKKIEELQRSRVERQQDQEMVVTEVNECEENC